MPALIDTGARLTLLTPKAVARVGLPKVNEMSLARAGGITEKLSVHVASIQFPRHRLATIEMVEVVCCELPEQPIECLLGRDVLSRWVFTYDGPAGGWKIEEEDVATWVDPPEDDS
jgi:predicted aspartyl protease